MCGRFLLESEIREIIKEYKIRNNKVSEYNPGDYYPSRNTPIVLDEESRTITLAQWGFSHSNNKGTVINARAESITKKPMFKNSIYSARCIIPANLFYEWKDEGNKKKVKHKISLQDSSLISLGGIYRISIDENSKKQISFVIITTEAEGEMKAIHPRMPLIIKNDVLDLWINISTSAKLVDEILNSNSSNKLVIERCEAEALKNNTYEQLRMF